MKFHRKLKITQLTKIHFCAKLFNLLIKIFSWMYFCQPNAFKIINKSFQKWFNLLGILHHMTLIIFLIRFIEWYNVKCKQKGNGIRCMLVAKAYIICKTSLRKYRVFPSHKIVSSNKYKFPTIFNISLLKIGEIVQRNKKKKFQTCWKCAIISIFSQILCRILCNWYSGCVRCVKKEENLVTILWTVFKCIKV